MKSTQFDCSPIIEKLDYDIWTEKFQINVDDQGTGVSKTMPLYHSINTFDIYFRYYNFLRLKLATH